MLSKEMTQLIQEIFAFLGESGQLAKEDPEACLTALLKKIKEQLPDVSAMLEFTVLEAAGDVNDAKLEAKKRLKHVSRK